LSGLGLAASALLSVTAVAAFAAGTAPTCNTVSLKLLDSTLAIDAAHVNTTHPPTAGSLVCSYYGNSGRSANEATINYLPAGAVVFAKVEASLASSHTIRSIPWIKSGAYSYVQGNERFLYVLDGTEQVQMYATVPLVKLELLAKAMPLVS
jgi:hypothetical protein